MIDVAKAGNQAMMSALAEALGAGGAARARLYAGARRAITESVSDLLPVAVVYLAEPAGIVDAATGDLILSMGQDTTLLQAVAPTWARVFNGLDAPIFDCDARMSSAPDMGQELVLTAPAGLFVGGLIRLAAGTLSARS